MYKKVLMVLAVVVGVMSFGSVASADHNPNHQPRVTICHSTQPNQGNGNGQGPQNNPYIRQTVSQASVNTNPNGHDTHNGPIFNNSGQDFWGDIIPPFDGYQGLNWTAEGQAIYNNGCGFVTEDAFLTFGVTCENDAVVVSLTNTGGADGVASVNGVDINVAAGTVETRQFNDTPQQIEIIIDQQTVYNQVVTCNGRGGGTVTTDKDKDNASPSHVAQVDPPKAGVNAGSGALLAVAGLASSVVIAVFGTLRLRKMTI